MPPAIIVSAWPSAIWSCAIIAAFMPEPHILLSVVAGTSSPRPASNPAWRAGACPCPAGSTQPMSTSSTVRAPAASSAARIAAPPRRAAGTPSKSPWKPPIGVRAAPAITTSRIIGPPCSCQVPAYRMERNRV